MLQKTINISSIVAVLLLYNIIAFSQERGIPFHRNYSVKDYNAASQNWAIVQDNRGIIYAGNDEGVLQYDGSYWKKIALSNLSGIRSLGVDSQIYRNYFNSICK